MTFLSCDSGILETMSLQKMHCTCTGISIHIATSEKKPSSIKVSLATWCSLFTANALELAWTNSTQCLGYDRSRDCVAISFDQVS